MATEQIRLVDGTIVRKCPTIKPLYCSRDGRFFSVHNMQITEEGCIMREIKPNLAQAGTRKCTHTNGNGTHYPFLRNFQNKHCHFLVAAAWYGPRPEGMVIDHLNGDILNWSADNLEYVTPAENRKRAKILRAMREAGNDPKQYSPARLKNIFAQYSLMDGDTQMIREMTKHQEL